MSLTLLWLVEARKGLLYIQDDIRRVESFQMVLSYSSWMLSKSEVSRHSQSSHDSKRYLYPCSLSEELPQRK